MIVLAVAQDAWLSLALFLGVAFVVAGGLVVGARLLAVKPRHEPPLQTEPYECGEPPVGGARLHLHPRYYVVALVFVIFDAEAALLFPWAMQARAMGMAIVIPGLVFLGVLMLGWLYAVRKGALSWR